MNEEKEVQSEQASEEYLQAQQLAEIIRKQMEEINNA
jgi:hypothetical protein